MPSASTLDFEFGLGWNFGVDNVFTLRELTPTSITPPPIGNNFLLLNGGNFLLLNGSNLSLL